MGYRLILLPFMPFFLLLAFGIIVKFRVIYHRLGFIYILFFGIIIHRGACGAGILLFHRVQVIDDIFVFGILLGFSFQIGLYFCQGIPVTFIVFKLLLLFLFT